MMRLPLLILHISGGVIGLLFGGVAMIYRKGSRGHRLSGDVFVVSMLLMGACGSILALRKHETSNVVGGLLTFYLVTTAWLTGRRRNGPGIFDWAAFAMAVAIGGTLLTLAMRVAIGLSEKPDRAPLGMEFFMGSIPLLAAAGDLRMLLRGGISGTARLTRHLWRMCFGWFIATGSFFLGQQQVFPESWRGSTIWFVPALLPLALLIFWVIRVRLAKTYRRMSIVEGNGAYSLRA